MYPPLDESKAVCEFTTPTIVAMLVLKNLRKNITIILARDRTRDWFCGGSQVAPTMHNRHKVKVVYLVTT